MKITSNITVSQKISNLFTENINDNYPKFINFVEEYYQSQEQLFGNIDILTNLLNYYNIKNYNLDYFKKENVLIFDNGSNITIKSTNGFPDSGFVKINNEYIYYKSKNTNTLIDCIRAVSTAEIIDGTFSYLSSIEQAHTSGEIVFNIAWQFSEYILENFKYIYLQSLPKKINPKVNFGLLISYIKDFYSTKGTDASIKFLFKILYDDTTLRLKLRERGFGAVISLEVLNGEIIDVIIENGGINYNEDPNYYPIITVMGVGSGAKLRVSNVVNGRIDNAEILSGGYLYTNSNSITITNKDFLINELVYCGYDNSSGVVEYWNPDTNILYLNSVSNDFVPNYSIFNNRIFAIVDKKEIIRSSVDIILPYDNVLKTNELNENFSQIFLELADSRENFDNVISDLNNISVQQKYSKKYNIQNIYSFLSNINIICDNSDNLIISAFVDSNNIFYTPAQTIINNFINNQILVDSTIGFPESGIIKISTEYISYTSKKFDRFLGITRNIYNNSFQNLTSGQTVLSYAGYDDTDIFKFEQTLVSNKYFCKFRLINIAGEAYIVDGSSGYSYSKFDNFTHLIAKYPLYESWSDNISSIYEDKNYIYILSLGKILDYNIRTSLEQSLVKRFKKNNLLISERKHITKRGIGLLINGVEINSYKGENISYGKILKLEITDNGNNYILPNISNYVYPYIKINDLQYFNLIKIYAKVDSINLRNISLALLENYSKKPDIIITRAIDDVTGTGLELECDYSVNGNLNGIRIINSGKWYTKIPKIEIINGGKYLESWVVPEENIVMSGFISKSNFTPLELSDIDFNPYDYKLLDIPNNLIYDNIPDVNIPIGSGAEFLVYIQNGIIISVTVENGGINYSSLPQLLAIDTDGSGAEFKCFVTNGIITAVDVIDGGSGYFTNPNLIISDKNNAAFECKIESWTRNIVFDNNNIDVNGGYVYNIGDNNVNFDNIPIPNVYPQYLSIKHVEINNNLNHSPLIGWSYDGCPIYGSYGFSDPQDSNSNVVLISTGWNTVSSVSTNRPNFPIGTFVEDYIYSLNYLDINNGRFCVTPEFPNGIYCYFASTNFPYYIGNNYMFEFDKFNHKKQELNFLKNLNRLYNNELNFPFPKFKDCNYLTNISTLSTGKVDNVDIEIPGKDYLPGDIISFDGDTVEAYVKRVNIDGGIIEVLINFSDSNLQKVPNHRIISDNGYGAILVFRSNSIGKIKSIQTITNGINFNPDPTINYQVNTDLVIDIKYNNTITAIKVIYGGEQYTNNSTISNDELKYNVMTNSNGSILRCNIIDGGHYYESLPSINIPNGTGAILTPVIEKSDIYNTKIIYYGTYQNYVAKGIVTTYNKHSSTVQICVEYGNFDIISENYYLWDEIGRKIGKIKFIRKANILFKSTNYKFIDNSINNNSLICKNNLLIDNYKNHQHSYVISSNHSISEWKKFVVDNVHMLGNKLNGIYKLENVVRLYLYKKQQTYNLVDYRMDIETNLRIFIFKVNLINIILTIVSLPEDLSKNTQFSKHYCDYTYFDNNLVYSKYKDFSIYKKNDTIWLSETDKKIILNVINKNTISVTDYTKLKFSDLVYGNFQNSILLYNGRFQNSQYNYKIANNIVDIYSNITNEDDLILFNLNLTEIMYSDVNTVSGDNNTTIKINSNDYIPNDINKLLVFINGEIISNFTVSSNILTFSEAVNGTVFCVYSDDITKLNLVSVTSKIYDITNLAIVNDSIILLFINGVLQTLSDYKILNNKIMLLTNVVVNSIIGWNTDSDINIDSNYQIIESTKRNIVPATINYLFNNGKLNDISILYAGLNYARYLKIVLTGSNINNNAEILLETLRGSIVKYKILSTGSNYNNSSVIVPIISEFGNIQTQKYPICDSFIYLNPENQVYVPIIVTIDALPSLLEVGDQPYNINLTWTLSRSPNTSVTITDIGAVDLFTLTNSQIVSYSTNVAITKTYTITAVDFNNISTDSTEVRFLFKNYWGNTSNINPNNNEIVSQANSLLSDTKDGEYIFTNLNNQYIYVAYPLDYGIPTFTFETFVVTFQQQSITGFINASGGITDYYVYRSDNLLNGSVTVTIS